jgi:hypothetical protein
VRCAVSNPPPPSPCRPYGGEVGRVDDTGVREREDGAVVVGEVAHVEEPHNVVVSRRRDDVCVEGVEVKRLHPPHVSPRSAKNNFFLAF